MESDAGVGDGCVSRWVWAGRMLLLFVYVCLIIQPYNKMNRVQFGTQILTVVQFVFQMNLSKNGNVLLMLGISQS